MEYSMYQEINSAFDAASHKDARDCAWDEEDSGYAKLATVNSEDLANLVFPRQEFIVDTLLGAGLCILAGAPKIGKSWLVLHLCLQVAKGEPFLGMKVSRSDVLYLALEDTARRIAARINTITAESSQRLHITNTCAPMGERFRRQLEQFVREHPDTRLVVIDTLQRIRTADKEMSYANDYSDMSAIKELADDLGICILLVHHTRKMPDGDYMNVISGTNGIAGSADTLMVLQKEKRTSRDATLSCTGRDVEDRELSLTLERETCTWRVKSDSLAGRDRSLPDTVLRLIPYAKRLQRFTGSNTEFTEGFVRDTNENISPNHLKRLMNLYVDELEDNGVFFESLKRDGRRVLLVFYSEQHDKTLNRSDDNETMVKNGSTL